MAPDTASIDLDQVQLADYSFWKRSREERDAVFAALRAERPIIWQQEMDTRLFEAGPGFWAVTRHSDILEVSRTPDVFCSGKGATGIADMPELFLHFFGSLINTDDPSHKRLRALISAGFTPGQLKKNDDTVKATAVRTINDMIEKGEGDFVADISAPFPIRVICDIVGVPESQHGFVLDMTNIILGGSDPEYIAEDKDMGNEILDAALQLVELMKQMRSDRLQNPTDDLTSVLMNAEIEGDRLTEQELASFFILLLVAGNETTRTALGQSLYALHEHPEQRALWMNDFDDMAPTAVEELIRWGTPVTFMRRTATQDTELGGQAIKEGDKVVMWYNSGNRDEEAFDDPYTFDLRRDPNDHVGFGGPGPHYCLGANLARREITIMFKEIFERMPDMEVTGEPDWLLSSFINGVKRLPIKWTPSSPS